MRLTEHQQNAVRKWAAEGATLGDIQKGLAEEFDVNVTYMETRFLIADLEVSLVDKDREPAKPSDLDADAQPAGADGEFDDSFEDEDAMAGDELTGGAVTVTIDQIANPNTMISGKVIFSDGEKAEWYVDAFGQLALNPTRRGYRPTPEDFASFQRELQIAARRAGY